MCSVPLWETRKQNLHLADAFIQVLERIIDVKKLTVKRGLRFRGKHAEAVYTLEDDTVDYGNFLEMIILLGK